MPPHPRLFLIVDNYVSSFMQFKAYEEPQKHPTRLLRFNAKYLVHISVTPVFLSVFSLSLGLT